MQTNFTLFLTVLGYFGVFCALRCILVENTVILGAPIGRRQMGNRGYLDPKRTLRHAFECIFVSHKLLVVKI